MVNSSNIAVRRTDDPATLWAKSRENLLTTLSSSELADTLPAAIRVNAFFSAKVAEARVLDRLREVSDMYNAGTLGHSEARVLLKDFLGARASDQSDKSAPSDLSALSSTARLDLIINQQEAMFSAVGQYIAGHDPDVKERFPCWEYHVGPNARPEHEALDGLILNKDDEFWANHTPPWDFNCNCYLTNAEEPEDNASGANMLASTDNGWRVNGIDYSGNAPATGYMFNPADVLRPPDIESVPEAYRDGVKNSLAKFIESEK
ncbi:MAG: phage head morphogenesis protein [Victivallaceae bacterium]